MPLVRYEVRCEHSLANPELFRGAGRDDPEGLLHGVAMAGLIGIVRQLGDLAEFAAEIFCDLHKELTTVGGRAHDLTVRVQQLEAELPAVEKALLSEPNQLRFAYTNGANWHASLRSDQNHCTSGELPRFVRNYYEECRGPPRLFLLDKFDVAGAGTCLKRYSDPSFFKLEWAKSELRKAQLGERDKKARQDKKKGRRRRTGHAVAAINQIPARVRYGSASLEDLDSLSPLLAPTLKGEVGPGATEVKRRPNVSAPHPEGGALKTSDKKEKSYQPNASENIAAGRMAGRISKIIEMEDREAVPPVGLVPRNKKSPKSTDRALKRSDSEAEAKRVTIENTTTRSHASKDGKAPGNPNLDSIPDIASRGNVAPAISTSENLSGVNGQVSDTSESVDRRAPTGNPSVSHQNNLPNMAADGVDEHNVASRGEPDVDPSVAERRTNEVSDADCKSPRLSPVRIKEVSAKEEEPQVISATSPNVSSQWSSPGGDDLRPSASMLSRLSYSSELMPFSSGSEPESPVSPNSPPFNALFSPPGSPSRALGSPTGLYAHHSGYSSPRESEIPVLSSSPRLPSSGPSRPPPPVPENSSPESQQGQPSSTTSTSVIEPSSTSPFRLTGSATLQPFHNSEAHLRSVDGPPTSNIDMLNSSGRQFEADPTSAPRQGRTSNPPSTLKQAKNIVPLSFSEGEEESVPSSPTGSVIIKDTPSPPGSPASNYSESGSEIHEYHHPAHDQSKSLMSPR